MLFISFKMTFQEVYKDLETKNVSMAKAQNAPYMDGSHTARF